MTARLRRPLVRGAALTAVLACAAGGSVAAAAPSAPPPARVQGRFTMRTVVTAAVNVRGEHRGERLTRTWRIRPGRCRGDVCRVLHMRRTRGLGRRLRITLHLRPDGSYLGHGTFFVALSCGGHLEPRGARAPYTIRLRVTAARTVGGIRFARRLAATYRNRTRIDRTHCAFTPSYDAARYSGRLRGALPAPPHPAFTATAGADGLVAFGDVSRPGGGPGRLLADWHWDFGDPASGAADVSDLAAPEHQFTAPGRYQVRLTTTDHAGLRASITETVVVPAPSPSARSAVG